MPKWTTMSLAELRTASLSEIIQNMAQWMETNLSKPKLLIFLILTDLEIDADARIHDKEVVTRDAEHGNRIARRDRVRRDVLTGDVVYRWRLDNAYYETGEIDVIQVREWDEEETLVSHWRVKHFTDGRQPIKQVIV